MRFSQKIGKRPIKTVLQVESIDEDLKNRLWNTILEDFFNEIVAFSSIGGETQQGEICRLIWKDFFNYRIDTIPINFISNTVSFTGFINHLRNWFDKTEWYDIYDFIAFIASIDTKMVGRGFTYKCNLVLEKEVSGYRLINDEIVQITSEEEIQEIKDALINTDEWQSVSTHLNSALGLLADRKNPDYRNSIKESVSAVESFCKIITQDDKATLGKALSEIEKSHKLHSSLKKAFSAIYGYSSDSSGIRHSLLESDVNVEFEDAKFMLVSCSAFINYLKSKIK